MKNMRTTLSLVAFATLAGGGFVPAFAAEGEAAKAGLPQLDATLFPAQIFWLVISFALLYVLMAYVAIPGVRRTQGKRHDTLSSDLAAAQAANEGAKEMMAQYEKALADARAKAQATVGDMAAAAAKVAAERQAVQQRELSARLTEAEGKITAARVEAIRNIEAASHDLANVIVEKVSGMKNIKVAG